MHSDTHHTTSPNLNSVCINYWQILPNSILTIISDNLHYASQNIVFGVHLYMQIGVHCTFTVYIAA